MIHLLSVLLKRQTEVLQIILFVSQRSFGGDLFGVHLFDFTVKFLVGKKSRIWNELVNNQLCRLISITNLMHKFFYSITICTLHYNPWHVSCINMPIFRRTNCIITVSDIVTLCKWLYRIPDESRLLCSLLSSGVPYCTVQRVTIPDAVIIQFVLLKMGMLMLETCRGL